MSDEKKVEWNKGNKDLAQKPPDATSPTEALNDAMKPTELGNKSEKGEKNLKEDK
jgi:hypothetical protein